MSFEFEGHIKKQSSCYLISRCGLRSQNFSRFARNHIIFAPPPPFLKSWLRPWLSPSNTVVPLWSAECRAIVCHNSLFSLLDLGQYCSNAMSTGIRVQHKVSFLIRVAEDRCLSYFSSSSFQLKTCVCSVHSDTLEGLGQARSACNFSGSVATPASLTMCPRNFTLCWNRIHFFGESFNFASCRWSSTNHRFLMWSSNVRPRR